MEIIKTFSAFTGCPYCGKFDLHHLRAPKPRWTFPQYFVRERTVVRQIHRRLPDLIETDYEVMRTCVSCKGSWGES